MHINVLGNQLEVEEGVRDSLLLGENSIGNWRNTVAAPRQCQLKSRLIQTDLRLQSGGGVFQIALGAPIHYSQFLQDCGDHIRPLGGIAPGGEKELVSADHTVPIGENASAALPLSRSQKRLPDRPCVDTPALKSCPRIGWRQEDGVYIVVVDSGLLQQLDQQKVNVGAFVERHFLALQFGHYLDRGIFGNENGFTRGSRRLVADVNEIRSGCLGEDGRGLAGGAAG